MKEYITGFTKYLDLNRLLSGKLFWGRIIKEQLYNQAMDIVFKLQFHHAGRHYNSFIFACDLPSGLYDFLFIIFLLSLLIQEHYSKFVSYQLDNHIVGLIICET